MVMAAAMLGRLLYNPNVDNRDVLLYLRGVGGSGKSSVLKMVQGWFERDEVAILANKTEEIFGLENYLHKKIIVAADLTKDANLDTGDILSIVSRDTLSIRRKNKSQVYENLDCHFIAAGNDFPVKWADTEGNFLRRIFIIDTPIPPQRSDPDFRRRLMKSGGHSLRFCNVAFLQMMISLPRDADFWTQIPERFLKNRLRFLANTSSLLAYVYDQKDCQFLETGEHLYCLEKEFTEQYHRWCTKYGHKNVEDEKRMVQSLRHLKCEIRAEEHEWPVPPPDCTEEQMRGWPRVHDKYVIGLGFRAPQGQVQQDPFGLEEV
jgi:phage/plasmid-associated DNA primase